MQEWTFQKPSNLWSQNVYCSSASPPILCKNRGQPPCNTIVPTKYNIRIFHMQSFLSYCYKKLFYISHDIDTTLHSGIPYNFPLPSSLAYFDLHVLPLAALFEYTANIKSRPHPYDRWFRLLLTLFSTYLHISSDTYKSSANLLPHLQRSPNAVHLLWRKAVS